MAMAGTTTMNASDTLQRSLDRKDNWLVSLAHEMQEPLAPLLNTVQVLHRYGDERLVINQSCATLTRQIARLVRLVDDLFELIDVENARTSLTRTALDLELVIAGAIQTSQPILAARGHCVEMEATPGPKVVEGDSRRLSQVFVNLLHNAARYTGDGGRIRVLIEPAPGWVLVKVRDSGAGIPLGMLPHVFEAYTRLERGSGVSKDGPGLQLAFTRYFVELHGGSVSAHSDGAGRGSEFVVRLPALHQIAPPAPSLAVAGRSIAVT
jgi:signal transduction histidine kinase